MAYLSLIYTFIFSFHSFSLMYILLALAVSSFLPWYHGHHIQFFFHAFVGFFPQSIYIQTSLHLRIPRSKHSVFGTIHRYLFQLVSLPFFIPIPSCCIVLASSLFNCTNLGLFCSLCISSIFTFAFLIHLKSWFMGPMTSRLPMRLRDLWGPITCNWLVVPSPLQGNDDICLSRMNPDASGCLYFRVSNSGVQIGSNLRTLS